MWERFRRFRCLATRFATNVRQGTISFILSSEKAKCPMGKTMRLLTHFLLFFAPLHLANCRDFDVELTLFGETLTFEDIDILPAQDVDRYLELQKTWYENYYRGQRRRLQRRRDSRDISTDFEFVVQNVVPKEEGNNSTTSTIIFNQNIGFLPTSRRRKLVDFDIDDMEEVLSVTGRIYNDTSALERFADSLRGNVESFETVTAVYRYPPMVSNTTNATNTTYIEDELEAPKGRVELTLYDEPLTFENITQLPANDIDAYLAIHKEWYENYYRTTVFRRSLQAARIRSSRDITTSFDFVIQNVDLNQGKDPVSVIVCNQHIGFLPPSSSSHGRKLEDFNIDDVEQVREVTSRIYRDVGALADLEKMLKDRIDSFAYISSVYRYPSSTKSKKSKKGGVRGR